MAKNNSVEISAGQVIEDIEVIVETKEEPGNISGHVLDARTGKPLREFSVKVAGAESGGEHSSAKHQVKFDESQDGVFSIANVPGGMATLKISAPGYESEEFQLRIRRGQTRKTVFYLGGGSLQVHVAHNGKGKHGAYVKARYLGEGPGFYSRGIEAGEEGSYEIKGLREGNYLVITGFQSVGAPVTYNHDYTLVKIEAGKTTRTDFKFQENAVIRGRFTFPDNVLYGRVCVFRERDENHDNSLREYERTDGTVMYIKKGHYEISNLPPGTYKVVGECIPKKKGTTIGTRSSTVTLGEKKTGEVDFDFL
jgi:hypothetical protein